MDAAEQLTKRELQFLTQILLKQDAEAEPETTVEQAVEFGSDLEATKKEAIDLLRKLSAHGLGQFRAGRRGGKSRLQWNQPERARLSDNVLSPKSLPDLKHSFHLRPGLTVSLQLPPDLTRNEAERLAGFIRTLPFEPPASLEDVKPPGDSDALRR